MGYSFQLAAMILLYASCHRQNNTYHGICYTSCEALVQWVHHEGTIWRPIAPEVHTLTTELHLAPVIFKGVRALLSEALIRIDIKHTVTAWLLVSDQSPFISLTFILFFLFFFNFFFFYYYLKNNIIFCFNVFKQINLIFCTEILSFLSKDIFIKLQQDNI